MSLYIMHEQNFYIIVKYENGSLIYCRIIIIILYECMGKYWKDT